MKKILSVFISISLLYACNTGEKQLVEKAEKIHQKYLTVDTHCDTPIDIMNSGFDLGVKHDRGCVDFPRMNEGGLDAEFFAVFIGQDREMILLMKKLISRL